MEHNIDQELLETIDAYIKGELKGDALLDFNKKLNERPELQEEVNLQRKLHSTLNESEMDWQLMDSKSVNSEQEINKEDYQLMSSKIKKVAQKYRKGEATKVISIWSRYKKYAYAAAVFAILFISVNLFKNFLSTDTHQYNYAQWITELPAFAEKTDDINPFIKAEQEFKNKNYKSAINLFSEIDSGSKYYPYSLMYMGASHDLLNENQKAIETFDKLIRLQNFEESTKGLWYKALIQIKIRGNTEAITTLKLLTGNKDSYYYDEAIKLLGELEYLE